MKRGGIIALLFIAAAVAIMMVTFGDTSTYVTFETAKANQGVEFHVVGKLMANKPQEYDPVKDPNYYSFYMADSLRNEMKVVYLDAKPIDIERAERVVVIGKAVSDSEFHASTILQKCPSKYKDEGIGGAESRTY